MKDLNLSLPKILDWLLLNYEENNFNFIPAIMKLLQDENIDLIDVMNYYFTHQNPTKFNKSMYRDLFMNIIKFYGKKKERFLYSLKNRSHPSLSYIVKVIKQYDSELHFDENENIFIRIKQSSKSNEQNQLKNYEDSEDFELKK